MKKYPWFLLTIFIVIIDQLSKHFALNHLLFSQPLPILPMLNFTLAFNTGAAFSFLSEAGPWHQWFFLGFGLIMSLALIIWIKGLPQHNKLQHFALSCILGGALGNFYDRLHLGRVVDFIELYYHKYTWPVFNIADIAICLGVGILFFQLFRKTTEPVL